MMKQILLAFFVVCSLNSTAQHHISIKSGVNLSNFNGGSVDDPDQKFRIGLGETIEYNFFFNDNILLQTGLSYNQRGYASVFNFTDENGVTIGGGNHHTNYDYLGITALIGFQSSGKIKVGMSMGALQSVLLSAKSKTPFPESYRNVLPQDELKGNVWVVELQEPFSRTDFGLQIGFDVGFELNKRMDLFYEISYYQSLTSFNDSPFYSKDRQLRHYSLFMGLGIRFELGNELKASE